MRKKEVKSRLVYNYLKKGDGKEEFAHLLGTYLYSYHFSFPTTCATKYSFWLAKYIFFKAGTRPQLLCPIKKLVDKLVARGNSKRGGNPGSDDSL